MTADDRKDLQNEIKLVLEITARVDERVKLVVEKQSEMTLRLNNFIDAHNLLSSRVSVLEVKEASGMADMKAKQQALSERLARLEMSIPEAKIEDIEETLGTNEKQLADLDEATRDLSKRIGKIEDDNNSSWSKIKYFADLGIKALWAFAIGYIMWRMGLQYPKSP